MLDKKEAWNQKGKYLYHSYKNENIIIKCIVLTILCLIINIFIFAIPVIWVLGVLKCKKNNMELDIDPKIQEQRKFYEKIIGK